MESAVNGYFEEFDISNYKQSIGTIDHCREQCIELKGGFCWKIKIFLLSVFSFNHRVFLGQVLVIKYIYKELHKILLDTVKVNDDIKATEN